MIFSPQTCSLDSMVGKEHIYWYRSNYASYNAWWMNVEKNVIKLKKNDLKIFKCGDNKFKGN